MNEDLKMTESIRDAINACTKRVDYAPSLSYRVLRKAKGEEEPVIKKASMTLVIVLIILALTAVAVAATVLWNWKDVGEKAAEMEGEYGYYEDWDTATKIKLVRDLYDMEALKGNADAAGKQE